MQFHVTLSQQLTRTLLCLFLFFFSFAIFYQDWIIMEFFCYLGPCLSAFIANKIRTMKEKTFITKMFLLYFFIDSLMGSIETYCLFKLKKDGRYLFGKINFGFRFEKSVNYFRIGEVHSRNCIYFITSWFLWNPNRMLLQTGIMFCRSIIFIDTPFPNQTIVVKLQSQSQSLQAQSQSQNQSKPRTKGPIGTGAENKILWATRKEDKEMKY